MKAYAINEPFSVIKVDAPKQELGPSDVRIQVKYIGLCGSDLNSYRGLMPFVKLPRIPGHEISGLVLEKGTSVPENINIGDKVTVSPYTKCGVCPACRAGRDNCCQYNQTLGVQREGALTEEIVVPFEKVFVSSTLSLEELVLVEPLSVGYHGANRGGVSEIDTVLVLGVGTIGMGALCAAVRKGATVIALDIDDVKLAQAKKFGAHYTINSLKQDARAEIDKITNGEGVSIAIEAAGTPVTFNLALDLVAFAGRVVSIGYSKNETAIKTQLIVSKELNIFGSRNALRVFPSVIQMFEKREHPFTDMITKVYEFDQLAEALSYWNENAGTVSKILIKVS